MSVEEEAEGGHSRYRGKHTQRHSKEKIGKSGGGSGNSGG